MMRHSLCAASGMALLLLGTPALADSLPPDAELYIQRRTECNHWAGEDAYDSDRARTIAKAVHRLRCDRLDQEEEQLRRRHSADPAVIKALDDLREKFF